MLEKAEKMELNDLKEQAALSNKKWDLAVKELTRGGMAKVSKVDDVLFLEVV